MRHRQSRLAAAALAVTLAGAAAVLIAGRGWSPAAAATSTPAVSLLPPGMASLGLSAQSGSPTQSIRAAYHDTVPCAGAWSAVFAWDTQVFQTVPAAGGRAGCSAGITFQPPPAASAPGTHIVSASLVDGRGQIIPRSGAAQSYLVVVTTPSTPPPPTAPPPTAPAPVATPLPMAASDGAPVGARTTPQPTPLVLAAGGTFPPYACRNGIPDTTPCPGATTASASASSSADPFLATIAPGSTGPRVPVGVMAAGVALIGLTTAAAGWRTGARRRWALGQTPQTRRDR